MTTLTLAGGCFWCFDAIYRRLRGVESVTVGYTGGKDKNPTYETVCSGATGHAEALQITFDDAIVSSSVILEIFFSFHDPTTLNRQGNDIGTQYRSALFYTDENQKQFFESELKNAQKLWDTPIVTEISPLEMFYPAEEYHQDYFAKNPANGYCNFIINPKLQKLREKFSEYWR